MDFKDNLRKLLNFFRLDLTKNLAYDRMTKAILSKVLKEDSNCVDIGCHKGEILSIFLKKSPKGTHAAFEPIPDFYNDLHIYFAPFNQVHIYPYALSHSAATKQFQYVKNAPAYSGLKRREYATHHPEIEEITVEVKTLDEVLDQNHKIDLIKIDVEGGEFDVLKGSERILSQYHPMLIFEFGLGASEFYDSNPDSLFDFLKKRGYSLYYLHAFLDGEAPLTARKFNRAYYGKSEYYFFAKYEPQA